jgi:hypothetical protein
LNTGPEDNHLDEAIRDFLREGYEEDRYAEWNTTSREYPKISHIDATPTTIVGVVKHAS